MRAKYFLIILITIIIFLGCGGGGGGSGISHKIISGQISGNISFDEMLASERAIIASNAESLRATGFNQAVVFIEELPARAVYPDSNGNYCFTDLPFDTNFHIITRINSLTGKVYKSRSSSVYLEETKADAVKNFYITSADEAKYQIRLQVNDTKDNPVGKCNIWLWGEEFSLDEGGCYLSPMMPLGATGKMKVIPPANKELIALECDIDSSTFQGEIKGVSSVTLPPQGITQKRAPYVSVRVGELLPGGSAIRIYGSATDPQNDYLEYEWTTNVGSFTYTSIDKSYVEWAIPSEPTNAVIRFKASQVSSTLYPLLYSYAELYIKISKDGKISFPGEIVIVPTQRSIDIISSATTQITGNTVAYYEANASFPNELEISYVWDCTDGTIESGNNSKRVFWHSPLLKAYESKVATLTCSASDGIATVSKDLSISVTAFPTIVISSPVDSEFYPGEITFTGLAKDYLGNIIDAEAFEWYIASDTGNFQFVLAGNASFTYNFTQKGQYSIALNAPDISGIVGSATKDITILNCLPQIKILSPENDSGYLKNDTVVFSADITDYEDGKITDPERVTWNSDIDNVIGSGTYFEIASLSKGMHTITVTVVDNDGATASDTVVIWYDMPARITLTPENGSVFFDNEFTITAKGVNEGNKPLDISTYKWYLDGADWAKDGVDTVTTTGLSSGLHTIKVIGRNKASNVVSNNYGYHVGYPKPVINSPASGTRFDIGSSITFVAAPTATGSLAFNWYLNGGLNSLGSSTTLTTTLDKGRYEIGYVGTDASGKTLCASTTVVVENVPVVTIDNVASGAKFFVTHDIEFKATADVPDSNVAWYLDNSDTPVKTGKNIALAQQGLYKDVEAGYHTISVAATGDFGTIASASVGFTSGIEAVSIAKPTNTTFAENENIEFLAKPIVSGLPMQWYLDGSPWKTETSFNHSFSTSKTYTVRLIATDSANIASFKDITLFVGLFPVMNFVVVDAQGNEVEPDNKAFFAETGITVRGSGIDPITGNSISGRDMTWYIYDSSDNPVKVSTDGAVNSQITINASTLSTFGEGIRKIELRGKANSSSEAYGSKTKQAYLNLPKLNYSEPVNNQIIHLDETKQYSEVFVASGTPNAVEPLKFEWWLNWNEPGAQKLTDVVTGLDYGSRMNLSIASGNQSLTFIGTDSAGVVSYLTKQLIISDNAAIQFTPGDGSVIFANKPFDMEVNDTVVKESIEWLLKYNGGAETSLSPRGSPYSVDSTKLSSYFSNIGYYEITASGVNVLNVPASITNKIYYGLADAEITSTASGTRFELGSLQNFVATPTADATYEVKAQDSSWYLDNVKLDTYNNICDITTSFDGGYHILKYAAIDSIGNETSDEIGILFDNPPMIGFAEPVNLENDIYIFAENTTFSFTGSGTVSVKPDENDPVNYKWYVNDDFSTNVPGQSIPGNSLNLHAGINTVTVTAEDQFGVVGTHTRTVYYGEPVAAISAPAEGQIFFNEAINLVGNASPNIVMEWYLNGTKVGTGPNCTIPIGDTNIVTGVNHVTYIGTDSFCVESRAEINFVYGDKPGLQIWLPNNTLLTENAAFFPDDLLLTGVGTSSTDVTESILPQNMKWYVDGELKSSGNSTYNVSGLSGLHEITLEAKDSNNVAGIYSVTAYFGATTPSIVLPAADNEHYTRNAPVETIYFEGNSLTSPIAISWILKDQNLVSTTQSQRTFNMTSNSFAPGYLSVKYIGIDSAGRSKTDERNIIVANEPVISFTPGNNSAILDGFGFTFSANVVQDDISTDGIEYKWEIGGNSAGTNKDLNIPANYSGLSSEFKNTVKLTVIDCWGISTYTTNDIYWKLPGLTITEPVDGSTYSGDYGSVFFRASSLPSLFNDPFVDGKIKLIWEQKQPDNSFVEVATGKTADITLLQGANTIQLRTEDSIGNSKMAVVDLISNYPPYVEIITPKPGDTNVCFFANSAATFIGSATERITGTQLIANNMTWSLDGGSVSRNDRFTIDKSKVNNGAHYLTFTATDKLNTSNQIILNFKYGQVNASITSPASGTYIHVGNQIDITAAPAEAGLDEIPMLWTLTNLSTGVTTNLSALQTNNSTIRHQFNDKGIFRITYTGTDSAKISSSSQIDVIVEEPPTVSIKNSLNNDADGSSFFQITTGNITFNSLVTHDNNISNYVWKLYSGTDTSTAQIDSATTKNYSITPAKLNAYPGYMTVELTASDLYGASNSETATFYYGITAPEIASPATYLRIPVEAANSGIQLVGNVDSHLTPKWFDGNTEIINPDSFKPDAGSHIIKLIATDSANVSKFNTVQIDVNDKPYVSIKNNNNTNVEGSVFFILSGTESIKFVGSATAVIGLAPIASNKMTWTLYTGEGVGGTGRNIAGNSDKTVTLNSSSFTSGAGTYTIRLEAEDALGFTNESIHTFYYGHILPEITQPTRTEFMLSEGASGITFEGNEDSNAHIDMTWYFNGVAGATAVTTTKTFTSPNNYIVSYKGTDASGREKSATKTILVNNRPSIHIQKFFEGTPVTGDTASNSYYFALAPGEQLKFQGDAKCAQDNSDIDTASLTWKLYSGTGIASGLKQTKSGVNPVMFSSSDIGNTAGTYTIALTATDKFGSSDTAWASFYYGHPVPTLSSPINGSKYTDAPASINLSAVSENPSFTSKTWQYCTGGIATTTTTASSINLGLGTYTISLTAVDSAGVKKIAASNIVINKDPIVTITSPTTDSYYFGGQTLAFTGTAKKGDGTTDLPASGITWYRSTSTTGTEKKLGEGTTSINVSAADIGTGTWYIRMVGVDSQYPPNQTSSTYIKITTGIDVPKITSPASGTRFDIGSNVALIGNTLPDYITMSWSSDDSKLSGTGSNANSSTFTRGWRTVNYSGTDSSNITHTAKSMILVDSRPSFTTAPAIVSPASIGNGKGSASGVSYPIIVLPRGTMLNFKTIAKNTAATPVEVASITWLDISQSTKSVVAGSAVDPKDFLMNLSPGSYTYSIIAEDELGVQASTTYSFWVWNCETYDDIEYSGVETIAPSGDSNLFVAAKSGTQYMLNKLVRKSSSSESGTESGDISIIPTSYAIGSWTPDWGMMGFDISGSTLYTLSGDNSSNLKLQKWKTGDLTYDGNEIQFTGTSDANLNQVGDITVSGGSLFVTDRTHNLVKKLSATTGALDLNSQTINNPMAIKYIDDNNIFVADTGNNRVLRMNNDCNITAVYNGVSSPSYLTYSSTTRKLYVTSTSNAKVHVIDTNTGDYLYSFGSVGTTANQPVFGTNGVCDIAICGSNTLSDMYIADKVNNRIVRVRCGLNW